MRTRHLLPALSGVAALRPPAAHAEGLGRPLSPDTLAVARDMVTRAASGDGVSDKVIDKILRLDVLAVSSDTGCPGVDVDVINATERTVWNIEVKITQKEGNQSREDVVHLPYLGAKREVRVSVSCISEYRSSYDPGGGISVDYVANGAKSLAEALPAMLTQRVDYTGLAGRLTPTVTTGRSLLGEALAFDDPEVARELVATIARTGVGREELAAVIASGRQGPILDQVADSMEHLPLAAQAQLARVLIGSPAAARWEAKLLPLVDRALCVGPRPAVVGLWLEAARPGGIVDEPLRQRVLARCAPRASDGAALVAVLDAADDAPAALAATAHGRAAALAAADPATWAAILAAWRGKGDEAHPSLLAFLRETGSVERFDQAAAAIHSRDLPLALISTVALAADVPERAHKAAWVDAQFATLTDPETVKGALNGMLINVGSGEVGAPEMIVSVRAATARAPAAAAKIMTEQLASDSKVFDPAKLADAGVDLLDFIAFNHASLGGCTATTEALTACVAAIAAYHPTHGKPLPDALTADFTFAAANLLDKESDRGRLLALAKQLRAGGLSPTLASNELCRQIYNWDRAGDLLADIEEVDPAATCLAVGRDRVAAGKRNAILLTIAAILGLLVPVPVAGFVLRKRWRKIAPALPLPLLPPGGQVAVVDERLAALGRALPASVLAAGRELAGTPAATALDAVTAPVVTAAVGTLRRAITTGEVATTLIEAAAAAIYVVALPVRDARPQVVQRYLGAAWPEHVAAVQRAAGRPVLALVLLAGPDAELATLLVGHTDGATAVDPEALLDARDARERGANHFREVLTLATPTPATTTATTAAA
jgi:hypothetical protein